MQYGEVIAGNVRAARARAHLNQADVVARMRHLGYENWYRPTMSRIENGERRVFAEEILGLAVVLETTIAGLMDPGGLTYDLAFPGESASRVTPAR